MVRASSVQKMVFDLQSALPQLLTPAVAWAEVQSQKVQQEGEPLSVASLLLAKRVGVNHPHLVRVNIVDQLPLPTEPLLRQAALQTGLLGPGMVGLTLGHSILVVRGHLGPRLLSHELRHVHQYEAHGSIAGFLPVYLEQIASVGYYNAPFEQDARAHELDG
jgi:hypothetical protein